MEPKNVVRGQVLFYISTWPGSGVKNEISIKIGYPLKPGSNVTVQAGTATFSLFVKDDKAFVANAADEQKLIGAMKAGNVVIVSGVSKRGTNTTDRYSLSGISAALTRMEKDCK